MAHGDKMSRALIAVLTTIVLYAVWPTLPTFSRTTHARLFCAYGKVFVEFEERNNTWGVLMLDNTGRPLLCNSNDLLEEEEQENTNFRGTI